jgi:hypothetical protein
MHHPGAGHSIGDPGPFGLRHGGENLATAAVVRTAGVPH